MLWSWAVVTNSPASEWQKIVQIISIWNEVIFSAMKECIGFFWIFSEILNTTNISVSYKEKTIEIKYFADCIGDHERWLNH